MIEQDSPKGRSYPECADGGCSDLLYPDSRFDDRKRQYSLRAFHRRIKRQLLGRSFLILGGGSVP